MNMDSRSHLEDLTNSDSLLINLSHKIVSDMVISVDVYGKKIIETIKAIIRSEELHQELKEVDSLPFYVYVSQNLCETLKKVKEILDTQLENFTGKIKKKSERISKKMSLVERIVKDSMDLIDFEGNFGMIEQGISIEKGVYLEDQSLGGRNILAGINFEESKDSLNFQEKEIKAGDVLEWESSKLKFKDYPCCIRPKGNDEFMIGFTNGKSCICKYTRSKKMFRKLLEMPQTLKPVLDLSADFTSQEKFNILLLQPGGYRAGTAENMSKDYHFEDEKGVRIFKIEMCNDISKCIMIKSRNKLIIYDIHELEITDTFNLQDHDILDYSYNKFMKRLFILNTNNEVFVVNILRNESKFEKDDIRIFNVLGDLEGESEEVILCSLAVSDSGEDVIISGYENNKIYPVNLLYLLKMEAGNMVGKTKNEILYSGEKMKKHFGQFNYISFEGLWDGKPLLLAGTVKEFHLSGFLIEGNQVKTLFEEHKMCKGINPFKPLDMMLFGAKIEDTHYFVTTRKEIFMIKSK